jgi:hypothetical protein
VIAEMRLIGAVDNGERSRARCAYAAREGWSADDVDKYCR